jgi:hypothetical protein
MLIVPTNTSTMGIAAIVHQDQGGGLQSVCFLARQLIIAKLGNSYSAHDLEA